MTVYRMIKNEQIPIKRLPTGTIVILDKIPNKRDYTVVYARVSSSQNKSNLESQAKRLVCFYNAKGWQVNQVVK